MTLKELRKAKNLTQEDVGAIVGTSRENIARYEAHKRKPPPDIALNIASVFGLSIEQMWAMFYAPEATPSRTS